MEKLLNMTRQTLVQEARKIDTMSELAAGIPQILSLTIDEIHLGLRQESEALYLAIQQLAKGHLSHHMVPVELLKKALRDMSSTLQTNSPSMQLVHNKVRYYYSE